MRSLVLLIGMLFCGVVSAQTVLPVPSVAAVIGVSCGAGQIYTYVTGFDSAGNITGEVYATTRCGVSGRGGGYHFNTYQGWKSIVWTLSGSHSFKLSTYDGLVPDNNFTEADQYGNVILDNCSSACRAEAIIVYVPQ